MRHKRTEQNVMATGVKPTLVMTQLPIFRVHYVDLENYVCSMFRWDEFDFLSITGAIHGMTPEYIVNKELAPAPDYHRQMMRLRCGHKTRNLQLIFTVLCYDGYIPAGKYIIDTTPLKAPLDVYKTILQKTGSPDSAECVAFRLTHKHDRHFTQAVATLDSRTRATLHDTERYPNVN
jgi:hypothetical protein